MSRAANQLAQYNRNAIQSATPTQLLTMLYDRLLLDLHRAEAAQTVGDWTKASEQLLHAQDIVAELQSSLDLTAWSGAEGLFALYAYVNSALINANVNRDIALTHECISHLEPLRATWHEAAGALPSPGAPTPNAGGWNVA
ncbi:flagellar export chaperone FliS [Glaciibacter psychrotolerans]|uniref:Flagellar secretion chaperone FliS n=1 Tax=Glaciibacter psychrotolerans TaxID=670054 RepID=A0A7Z0EBS2_9MICO|nr:flagellar export chaperone FliS [Leifsonia psychrotolerans]NYJ18753.1 flagellar protein FliS [Leifsonia psychrotolerans]